MKILRHLALSLVATGALAQAPAISPELLGTWSSVEIDCTRAGPSTLIITETSVTRSNIRGTISGSRIIGRRTVEVLFERYATGPHSLGVRTFVLSTDGKELHEMEGGKILTSRRRCAPPQNREGN